MIDSEQFHDLSPASQMAILKEHWSKLDNPTLFDLIARMADEFAKGSPNKAGWHAMNIVDQCGIRIARPKSLICSCGKKHSTFGF